MSKLLIFLAATLPLIQTIMTKPLNGCAGSLTAGQPTNGQVFKCSTTPKKCLCWRRLALEAGTLAIGYYAWPQISEMVWSWLPEAIKAEQRLKDAIAAAVAVDSQLGFTGYLKKFLKDKLYDESCC